MKKFYILSFFLLFLFTAKTSAQIWDEVIKTVASDRAADDYFGRSVAIDHNYAVVGSPREDHDTTGGNPSE